MATTDDLRWTHLTVADVEALAELTNHLAEVDRTEEVYTPELLAEELAEHGFTPETDSWAVWDGSNLVAFGRALVSLTPDHEGRARCWLSGGVHAEHRGRGIGRALMDRMEHRALALASERHPGVSAYLRASGGLEGSSVRRMLASRGYAVVRYFNDLERPLPGDPLPEVEVDGAVLMSTTDEQEEAVRTAHNAAFRDHWGTAEITPEQWRHYWHSSAGRPALSTVAVDDEGRVLAYVLASQFVPGRLHVTIVGTVPDARGRGLAGACLVRTLRLGIETGVFTAAQLDVDSDSLTGATRLYERLGFSTKRVFASMQRDPA
jgi:mycothiol synthase